MDPQGHDAHARAHLSDVQAALTRRVSIQFGLYLRHEGEDAMPSHGIGPFMFELDKYQPVGGFARPKNLVGDVTRPRSTACAFSS